MPEEHTRMVICIHTASKKCGNKKLVHYTWIEFPAAGIAGINN
jgi:hypothetical protein